MEKFKPMAITYLKAEEVKSRLKIDFKSVSDMMGPLFIAENPANSEVNYRIRIRENSPEPSTELLLNEETGKQDLKYILKKLRITKEDLFWIHPRAGGTLRRVVVDNLISNLEMDEPLIQLVVGPRQVGKTTAVEHLMREWENHKFYFSADSVVDDHGPWLESIWQKALSKGEGTLLVIDEIQKIDKWVERVKALWDKTKKRGIRVVVLGSTSLTHFLTSSGHESLAGRFNVLNVPHWSSPETAEAFGTTFSEFTLFGGYPKAMELSKDTQKWSDYIGQSIINPIIDIDIFQMGNFKKIENLRRAFKIFSKEVCHEINYKHLLDEIQKTGNIDIVKKYIEGYSDSFLFSSIKQIDDKGKESLGARSILIANCAAIYSFGSNSYNSISRDEIRFKQSVAHELKRVPHVSFGHWQKGNDVKMDYYLKTKDNKEFGIMLELDRKQVSKSKSIEHFRKIFKDARIAMINPDNVGEFSKGPRAFLENVST
jgi:predicted AAA+ superfamily ATPase